MEQNKTSEQQPTYANNPPLTSIPIIIVFCVVAIVVVAAVFTVPLRYRERKNAVARIPRELMPFLRPGDLTTARRKAILAELVRVKGIQIKPQIQRDQEKAGSHLGWRISGTQERGDHANIHFKTSIAKSYLILEKAAIHKDRALERPPSMCIRDYIQFLQENCAGLNHNLCRFFIENYERARFSQDEFTLEEYASFMAKFLVLIQAFDSDMDIRVS